MEAKNKTLERVAREETLEEAEEVLVAETAEHPSYPDLRNTLGLLLYYRGREERAKEQFERAISINSDYLSAISSLAHCFLKTGDLKNASRWFQREVDIFPFASKAYVDMWSFFYKTERLDDAERMALRAKELSPEDPLPFYLGLRTAIRQRKPDRAEEFRCKLRLLEKDNKILPLEEKDLSSNEIEVSTNLFELFEYLAFLSAKNERMVEAHEWLLEAQRVRPRLGEHLLALARIDEARGEDERALELKEKAIELSPSSPECWIAVGFEYAKRGLPQKALLSFEKTLKLAPGYADIHFNCGLIHLEMGSPETAIERFTDALRINPGYSFARNSLASTLAQLGEIGQALDEYEKTMRAGLESPEIFASVARLHLKKGNVSDAILFLKRAVEDKGNPPSRDVFALFSRAYRMLGDRKLEKEWQERFNAVPKNK